MSKRKILIILILMTSLAWMGHLGYVTFQSRTKSYRFLRAVETTVEKIKPRKPATEKKISDHLFYISTPIGSVGIF